MYADALRFLANEAVANLFKMLMPHDNGISMQDAMGNYSQSATDSTAGNIVDSIYGSSGSSSGGSSGGSWINEAFSFIGSLFNSGGRASGGPVDAGHLYRVNEDGPELLTVGGKSYLMMGRDSGNVTPNNTTTKNYAGNRTTINVQVQPTSSRRSADQIAQQIARKQRIAMARN